MVHLGIDRTHYRTNRAKNRPHNSLFTPLRNVLEEFQLDVWRKEQPQERDFTFFSSRHNIHTRIDFILISKPHVDMIVSAQIGPKILTTRGCLEHLKGSSAQLQVVPKQIVVIFRRVLF